MVWFASDHLLGDYSNPPPNLLNWSDQLAGFVGSSFFKIITGLEVVFFKLATPAWQGQRPFFVVSFTTQLEFASDADCCASRPTSLITEQQSKN